MAHESEAACEDAERVLRARYYSSVRSYAEEISATIRKDLMAGAYMPSRVSEKAEELTCETLDGSEWIIYTWRNFEVLRWSENHNACTEADSTFAVLDEGANVDWQLLAWWAMRADILESINVVELEGVRK